MRFALVATLALSTAALAQEAPPAPPAATPAVVPEKKICRSEPQLGSIMIKRTCHTRAEWASIDAVNRANVEQMQNRTNNSAPRN